MCGRLAYTENFEVNARGNKSRWPYREQSIKFPRNVTYFASTKISYVRCLLKLLKTSCSSLLMSVVKNAYAMGLTAEFVITNT